MKRFRTLWTCAVIAVACVAVIAQEGDDDVAAQTTAVQLRLVDQGTKAPLAGARLFIRRGHENAEATTDANGQCRLVVPTAVAFVEVRIEAEAHIGARQRWRKAEGGRLELPAILTLALPRGVSVGGQVVNEEGRPVEGAVVRVSAYGTPSFPDAYVRNHAVTTDASGRWTTDPIFPRDVSDLRIGIAHPEYISHAHSEGVSTSVRYMTNTRPSVGELYEHAAVITVERGITVSGRVLDAQGRPVPDTTVAQETPGAGRPLPAARTNADGTFRFQAREGPITVVVHPDGHAPAAQDVEVGPNLEAITLEVQPGAVLRGRVVGPDGAPLADVLVGVETHPDSDGPKLLPWRVLTDADGRFEWRSAPHEPASYAFIKEGYLDARGVSLVAGEQEYVLKLVPKER